MDETSQVTHLPADRFLDRELSWLAFNHRVLELAADTELPTLERAKYLGIFAGNLDEFFMVRVAGLKRRLATGLATRSTSGLSAREVHDSLLARSYELMREHAQCFHESVLPALAANGISLLRWEELRDDEQLQLRNYFNDQVFPVLTPLAVDPSHPFPYISGLSLNLAVVIRSSTDEIDHFARVKVPPSLPRFIEVRPARFVPLEDLISGHLQMLFPGMEIIASHFFRVTRNEELEVEEDDAENLLQALERELLRRRFGPAVRLEVERGIDAKVLELLTSELGVAENEVFHLAGPLDLTSLTELLKLDRDDLKQKPFVSRTSPALAEVESSSAPDVLEVMRHRDVLLHHPYDSFSTSMQLFLEQAAQDPNVLAIKQTLYRTSGDSPIVDALINAAEWGKQVLAVVEIKARFDEQNNIDWARKLEEAGVHVVYGLVGLKTHAKLCLVVRNDGGKLNRYVHIGTGNYNPKTARLYEDFGLLTTDPEVGNDVASLFNHLSGYGLQGDYKRLLVAPKGLRTELIKRIEDVIAGTHDGKPGRIRIKVNSLVDEAVIDELYRASQNGVLVDLWVRGICTIRPGVVGLSENIRVRSILGRFLEHSRVYEFSSGTDTQTWIGSADLMHRNLDRRVETLVRIGQPDAEVVGDVFDLAFAESTAAWHLSGDGQWARIHRDGDGEPLVDLQEELITNHPLRHQQQQPTKPGFVSTLLSKVGRHD